MTNQDADAGGLADAELMGRLSSKLGHRDYYDLITMLMRDRDERFALEARLAAAEAALREAEQERARLLEQLEPGKIGAIVQGMQSLAEECGWHSAHSRPEVLFIRDRIEHAEARAAAAEAGLKYLIDRIDREFDQQDQPPEMDFVLLAAGEVRHLIAPTHESATGS